MRQTTRNLIMCIDGTANDETDPYPTNVLKFHRALDASDPERQVSLYQRGVGNEVENTNPLWQKLGFNFGLGATRLRDRAYKRLNQAYRPGDRLFLFGFSRGAAIARMLAVEINQQGLGGQWVAVEMLGVWDTVASFGVPLDVLGIPLQQVNLFKNFTIARNIKKAWHLLAVDEDRVPFRPTPMNFAVNIEEIWFPGEHNNVGGGWPDSRLSDISLKFMIDRASERGLRFRPEALAALRPNPLGQIYPSLLQLPREPRPLRVLVDDEITRKWPTVHASVFQRMEALGPDYQPPNVLAWGKRVKVVD